jgi:hypothetical protein
VASDFGDPTGDIRLTLQLKWPAWRKVT